MENELNKVINHWRESSDEDFDTMLKLYDAGSYNWSLFLGHVCVEKLLKALYSRNNGEHAPYTHNLFRLAEQSEAELPLEYTDWLDEITSFNINTRYNDYKREFYNKCTKEFAELWIERIRILRTWIKEKLL